MRDEAWERITPRPLTKWEKAYLRRLAPEASDVAINDLRAVGRCTCGCVSIGFVTHRRPLFLVGDAEASDIDSTPIMISFLTTEDEVEAGMLEVQRADSEPVKRVPEPDELTIRRTSRWGAT